MNKRIFIRQSDKLCVNMSELTPGDIISMYETEEDYKNDKGTLWSICGEPECNAEGIWGVSANC